MLPAPWEVEEGRAQSQGQPGLNSESEDSIGYRKTFSKKGQKKETKKESKRSLFLTSTPTHSVSGSSGPMGFLPPSFLSFLLSCFVFLIVVQVSLELPILLPACQCWGLAGFPGEQLSSNTS